MTAAGCKISAADARALEQRLVAAAPGLALVPFPQEADVYVLLTCTVTAAADRDTRKLVARLRRARPAARIVLSGCLAEAQPQAAAALEGVWRVLSHHRLSELPALLADAREQGENAEEKACSTPSSRSPTPGLRPLLRGLDRPFLKVQDGCDTGCSYCILPRARGRSRSVPLPLVLEGLAALEQQGAQEVVLAGINLGSWGRDLEPRQGLVELLAAVFAATRLGRVRISSIEPEALTPEVLELLAAAPAFCRHLHVPLQSGDDGVLARMQRRYRTAAYDDTIARVLERLPGCGLGTDLITGFPGEDAAAHRGTCERVARLPFSALHVFTYSVRQGTRAAALTDDVPPTEKKRRTHELCALGLQARQRACVQAVGRSDLELLLERKREPGSGRLTGYSREYLPVVLEEPPDGGDGLPGRVVRARGLAVDGERLLARVEPQTARGESGMVDGRPGEVDQR